MNNTTFSEEVIKFSASTEKDRTSPCENTCCLSSSDDVVFSCGSSSILPSLRRTDFSM